MIRWHQDIRHPLGVPFHFSPVEETAAFQLVVEKQLFQRLSEKKCRLSGLYLSFARTGLPVSQQFIQTTGCVRSGIQISA